jgi:hypothetical protein
MSFLETRPLTKTVELLRPTLDPSTRDEIVTVLARLIANAVMRSEVAVDDEARDE